MPSKVKRFAKDAGIALLCIGIAVYVIIHLAQNFSRPIETEPAMMVTLEDSFTADGYIVRSEEPVTLDESGIVVPAVSEGERVSVGSVLFSVYSGENDSETEQRIKEIDEKIATLSKSVSESGNYVTDIAKVDEKIELGLTDILYYTASNSLSRAEALTDTMLVNMNRRRLMTGIDSSFDKKIEELEAEKLSLQGSLDGTPKRIYSQKTGYFSGNVDGYEGIFDPKKLSSMSTSEIAEMLSSSPNEDIAENAAGKIVTDFKWRIVVQRSKKDIQDFEVGDEYPVIFPSSGNAEISMTLERIIAETDGIDAVLVFCSGYMPQNFNFTRKQEIEVVKKRYTGLGVRKSAMRVIDGEKGVYILSGNTIKFRYAEELCESNDYYIIDATTESYLGADGKPKVSDSHRLTLYDKVVISGKDLYEGKIIE